MMKIKQSLSAGALTMLAVTASAQSEVSLYGLVDAMTYRKQLAGEAYSMRVDSGGLSTSFWGVRGREDLGGGLSAQFDLTSFFRMDAGAAGRSDTDPFFARSSWVGLQSDWGSVRLGRQSTLAFINLVRYSAFGGSSPFNPTFLHNYQSSATQPMMTASGATDSVWNNVVSYTSPELKGFSGALFYAPSEGTTDGKRAGGTASYTGGAFSAGLAIEKITGMGLNFSKPPANVRIDKSDVLSLGASYDFAAVKVFGNAVRTRLRNPATTITLDTNGVGATVPVGSGQIMWAYGDTKVSQALTNTRRRTMTLGYDYNLSKRTDLYAVILQDRVTNIANGTGFAVGIRHRF